MGDPGNEQGQEDYEDFYEDVFEELSQFGEILNLAVCDNLAHHLSGNVYVQFREEEQAQAALQGLQGRYYEGRPIEGELSPVSDFRESTCRQFEESHCTRGGYCNFMHLRAVSRATRKVLWGRYKGRKNCLYLEELHGGGMGSSVGYRGGGYGGGVERRGGFDDRRGGYDDRRGGYDRRGGHDDRGGGYDRRGGYDDRRGGYSNQMGGDDSQRDGVGRGAGREADEERRARIAAWNSERAN